MSAQLPFLRLLFGAVVVGFGLLSAAYPYRIALIGELTDAIGSTRPLSEVEPAGWTVTMTRIGGIAVVPLGVLWSLPALCGLP